MNQPQQTITPDPQPGVLAGDKGISTGEVKTIVNTAGGSLAEAIAGFVVAVLGIVGLSGRVPGYDLLPIAAITLGVALLLQGVAMITDYFSLFKILGEDMPYRMELGGGMSVAILAGLSGIILGILALSGVAPWDLIAVATIVLGTGLLLSIGALARLNALNLEARNRYSPSISLRQRVAHEATTAANGVQALAGLAAIPLGIIALTGIRPEVLILVAMLVMGIAIMLSGATVSFDRTSQSSRASSLRK